MFLTESQFIDGHGKSARHAFFGRTGGVSTGIFSSLNCGPGTPDEPDAVRENRRRAAAAFDAGPERLVTLRQVHSSSCIVVDEPWTGQGPEADAMVTERPGIILGVLSADCAPVLFYGEKPDGHPVIGAAHAGWGGALKGVCEATVAAMLKAGVAAESLRACIGPCIGPASYEVQAAFRAPFLEQDPANEAFFYPAPAAHKGHLMFDLPAYIGRRLHLAGVVHVFTKGLDTCFNEEDYFSFRRATHRMEPDYGRQLSGIVING